MSLPAAVRRDTCSIRPSQKFEGHTGWITGITCLPNTQQMVTCSNDGSIRVWDLQTGKQIAIWLDGSKIGLSVIALSPSGKRLVSGSIEDSEVKVWNTYTGKAVATWTGNSDWVTSICWNRGTGPERLLSGYHDGTIKVWDVGRGKTILEIKTEFDHVWGAIYSPDMTMIAHGGFSREEAVKIKIRDADTGKLITNLKGHEWTVYCLVWTADGTTLISSSEDETIRTWNTTTWQQIAVLTRHRGTALDIAISPGGQIFASASLDKTAQLWNLKNGQPIGPPIEHPGRVRCISFSTDGSLMVTGCDDGNAYSWDISAILKEADLNGVLLSANDGTKPSLDADHRTRPSQTLHRLTPGFFGDPLDRPSPIARPIPPSSTGHNTRPRLSFLKRAQRSFIRQLWRQNDDGNMPQEPRPPPTITNVPLTKRKHMYYSKNQVRIEAEKKSASNKKNPENTTASSSQPFKGSGTRQPAGLHQAQSSSGSHTAATTSSVGPPDAAASQLTTPVTPPLDVVTVQAGCLTRFLLFVGCLSA